MKNIVIAGVGNIGKRHLQGLLKLKEIVNIYLYDKSTEQIKNVLIEIEKENIKNHNLITSETINNLPKEIDVLILATSSNVRRIIFEDIVKTSRVKNIIFEKVLFQKVEDYFEVESILKNKNIKAWINCPRREWKGYQKLKELLKEATRIEVNVSGSKWGLGCNGIHMLDVIEYISGRENLVIDISELNKNFIESKRKDFLEIEGTIKGRIGKCDNFSISSYSLNEIPILIEVNSDILRCIISEREQKILYSTLENNWQWKEEEFKVMYQSQLSNISVENILKNQQCNLTKYEDSMYLHLKFIEPLIEYFEKLGIGGKQCPIT